MRPIAPPNLKLDGYPGVFIPPGGRRGNAVWLWRGPGPTGRRTEISTGETSREGAAGFVRRYLAAVEDRRVPAAGEGVTFATAARLYADARRPGRPDEKRIARLVERLGALPCDAIVSATLQTLAVELLPHARADSRTREIVTPARAILHFASEQGWCAYRRFRSVRPAPGEAPPALPRATDDAVVAAVLERCGTPARRAFILLTHERGIRIGEALRLEWEDVDLPGATATVEIRKPRPRSFAFELSPDLVAALAAIPPRPRGHVFPWGSRSNVYRWLRAIEAEGGPRWRPHESRRAVVTDILKATGDIRLAQEYVGHGSPKTTLRYRVVDRAEIGPALRQRRVEKGGKG